MVLLRTGGTDCDMMRDTNDGRTGVMVSRQMGPGLAVRKTLQLLQFMSVIANVNILTSEQPVHNIIRIIPSDSMRF